MNNIFGFTKVFVKFMGHLFGSTITVSIVFVATGTFIAKINNGEFS